MLLEKHGFSVQEDIIYKDGNLIVYKNDIAYKFEFEVKVPLSVIFNREGDCLEISTRAPEDKDQSEEDTEDAGPGTAAKEVRPQGSGEDMVAEIVDMISEINKEGE
eukprot:Anaeramoba_ignava/a89801_13.p4 GENE.a89801_13~~a89801_13.p4  ORF type:complete len:106 (-),score=8.10 a89801_13:2005-2322(-)